MAKTNADTRQRTLRRRRFLKLSGGVAATAIVGGVAWLNTGQPNGARALSEAYATLDRLDAATLTSTGEWTPFRIFSHAAQSVEMSMSSYPEHKSALFKHTLGSTAFSVFRRTGRMRHSLSEPIPGAVPIEADGDVTQALQRLRRALLKFDNFEGALQPHFAYGVLSKPQYAAAHVMHMQNHLSEIVVTPA